MIWKNALAGAAVVVVALALAVSEAAADAVVSGFGSAAGQTLNPGQIGVDSFDGALYVADRRNNRVDVFDAEGHFTKAFGWGVATGAPAFQACTSTCRAGIAGTGPGQFNSPSGIAVDNDPASESFRSIYVYDAGNHRVQKFTPAGVFALTFGGGVNKTTGSDLCLAGSGDICGSGSEGPEVGEFGIEARPIATGPAGIVYVGDSLALPPQEGNEQIGNRVQTFTPAGVVNSQFEIQSGGGIGRIAALAVDSKGGVFLSLEKAPGNSIRKYDGSGNLERIIPDAMGASALALDVEDHLFAAERSETLPGDGGAIGSIVEYDSAGLPLRRFGYGFPAFEARGLAPFVGPGGDIYASEASVGAELGSRVLHVSFAPPGPVVIQRPCSPVAVGNTKATVECALNPEGSPTTVHFQFIDQAGFEQGGFANPATQETPESESIGDDFSLHNAPLTLEGLEPETTYHFRVVATNADGGPVLGVDSTFTTKPPLELGDTWSSEVGAAGATLNAEVNPLALPATGFFEYVDDAEFQVSEFANASQVPDVAGGASPIDFGAGEAPTLRSTQLGGLTAKTTYHYRLVVSNAFVTVRSPAQIFRTAAPAAPGLPDARGYELVSPAQKGSAEAGGQKGAAGGLNDSGFTKIQQGSPDGEAFTFTSFTSFGDPKSAPGTSQYLAGRTAAGWTSLNITPAGHNQNPLRPPSRGFTPDLSLGAMAVDEPALTPEADPDHANIYLQTNATGALQLLSLGTPQVSSLEPDRYCVGFGGASTDGKRAFFLANGALTANAPVAPGFSLYEWSAAGGVRLVSVLPGEVAAQPARFNGFGAAGIGCGTGQSIVSDAVSADGSKVFWTLVPKSGATRLIARVNGTESVQIDAKQGGTGNSGNGKFRAASSDGSKVIFFDNSKLVPGAGEGSLYRFNFAETPGARLSNLTPSAQPVGVEGVLGASDDATSVYFVATGVLDATENDHGQKAIAGKNNLYLWHEDEGVTFIATLLVEDADDWSVEPREQTARVSPDGSALTFVSRASLTGYDNEVDGAPGCQLTDEGELTGDPHCEEVFLFDAEAGELSCASCDPTFARPRGPASLPAWSSPFQQPRYLSADGSRLFFQTLSALDPSDTNGRQDVYELERVGSGSCEAGSPTFSESAGGCLFLVSSGTSSDESFLLDASEDGGDVFFSTRQQLVGQDIDERYDVYDARVDGGFAPPAPEPEACVGEACRPGTQAPPAPNPLGSAGAGDGGNVKEIRGGGKPLRCRKGTHKVKRGGKVRCVKNTRKAQSKRRAHDNGRASR